MSVSLHEHKLGGLRWIVLHGPDREAFGALGEHARGELAGLTEAWPALGRLRRHVSGPPGRDLLAAVRRATAQSCAAEWAELAAFADGAGVPFDDLALLNLRGDLGLVDGGIGCSDLAWRRERSVIAHNEDGAPEDVGRCGLLTLASGERPPVTVFWYPGFLPANAFAVTGGGLVCTIDHLPVVSPGPGAGRHFVSRGLQRSVRTADEAVGYLRSHPSAGGFAYTIGDQTGRVVNVEAAAGQHAMVEAGPGPGPALWHTNHGRYVPGAEPEADGTSAARGETLDALGVPAADPGPSWFLRVLTTPPPDGVRSDPGPGDRGLTTLCTLVADLTAGEAVIAARDEQPVAIPLADLAEGNHRSQRPFQLTPSLSGARPQTIAVTFMAHYNLLLLLFRGGRMFDPDQLPELKSLVRQATRGDSGLLDEVIRDVALLRPVTTIQPRTINSISLVASDGGNNRLEFNPFSLQVVRVVDTFGDELFLDVISPSTDTATLGQRHLDDPASPLGKMMRDLGASALGQLSPFIPAGPKSGRWPLVYRDLCEWAVLYDLVCHERWGSDTLIIRDGLLRTRIFAGDLFVRLYGLMKAAIERKRREHKRQVFLVGIAKHSRIIERYRLAMAVEEVFPAGRACYAPVPPELQVKVYDLAEYVRLAGDDDVGKEKPRFNMGAMYLVRFGQRAFDPVWTMDLLQFQAPQAQQVFGSLLADAEVGFPVPCYPHCLQEADRYAQVVDLDLVILQSALEEAVREQIRADRRHVFDAQRLSPADPAAGRYQ